MNSLKNLLFIPTLLVLIFSGCSDDEESGPSYEFLDQNLQGSINGVDFALGDGVVELSDDELTFDLYSDMEPEAGCDIFIGDHVRVFFDSPNKVGLTELSFDFSTFSGQTITLFDPDGNVNLIATEGALEITSITETTVTGKIDARSADGDAINGNFTATFCQ